MLSGWGAATVQSAVTSRACSTAVAQATYPPQPCPTSTALRAPSAFTTPDTSWASVTGS